MDIEFHYYITYLITARAGFDRDDALLLAGACQAVDDNTRVYEISHGMPSQYENYVSQTLDLLRPHSQRRRIYPVFHFVPGDPDAPSARRVDGRTHVLNTTPDSALANRCFDDALATDDRYQIGIACHAFADTWAHQNFVGDKDDFNGMPDAASRAIPDIGHADAAHDPDVPNRTWTDLRLAAPFCNVDNNCRFHAAAGRLFDKLAEYRRLPGPTAVRDALLQDVDAALAGGGRHRLLGACSCRTCRYKALANRAEYGVARLSEFGLQQWFDRAVETRPRPDDPREETYHWRDPQQFQSTHWYRFQEAVKAYQGRVLSLYDTTAFASLDAATRAKIMRFR